MAKVKKNSIELSDVNRELKKVVNSGKMVIGTKEAVKAVRKNDAKIVIHASNCPEKVKERFNDVENADDDITVYEYPANSFELGLACGKPYSIASLCITDTGESEILRLLTSPALRKEKISSINRNR
jgi:large subunit ribosomal protein L30e